MNQNYKNCIIDNKENDKFDLGVNGFTDIWNPFVTLLLIATIIVTISSYQADHHFITHSVLEHCSKNYWCLGIFTLCHTDKIKNIFRKVLTCFSYHLNNVFKREGRLNSATLLSEFSS